MDEDLVFADESRQIWSLPRIDHLQQLIRRRAIECENDNPKDWKLWEQLSQAVLLPLF